GKPGSSNQSGYAARRASSESAQFMCPSIVALVLQALEDSRPPQGPATRSKPRKCHDSETDHGVIAVRQPGKARWRKIDMSCALRPYTAPRIMGATSSLALSVRSLVDGYCRGHGERGCCAGDGRREAG